MPKQVIVIMQDNYPFGECEECTNENTRVLVRKIYEVNVKERNKLLQKVNILRKLKNEHMIKIESVLEEEESIHFLFEYIPIKLETWISNINDQFIENFRDQLIKFSSFLANNFIKIEFQLRNIGMDQNYGAKYFLDLNFDIDSSMNREKLKSTYIREITNLFRPYIMNASSSPNYPPDNQRERYSNDFKSSKEMKNTQDSRKIHDNSISPPTNKANNANNANNNINKNKEKALAQYYQEVNMSVDSENEKILQEFMDVLDNEEEEEVKAHHQPPPAPPAKPQPQQSSPQVNQFQKQNSQQTSPSQPQQQKNTYQPFQQQQQQSPAYQQNNYQSQNQYQGNQYNQFSSVQQLPSSQYQQNQAPQFHTQSNLNYSNANQNPPPKNVNNSQSIGRGKSEMNQSPQNEKWRESADLQNRVKNAIQKSMNVIKKFKAIKDDSLV